MLEFWSSVQAFAHRWVGVDDRFFSVARAFKSVTIEARKPSFVTSELRDVACDRSQNRTASVFRL
jgi:hypothetical protein